MKGIDQRAVAARLLAVTCAAAAGCSHVTSSIHPGTAAHPWTEPGVLRISDISDPSTLNPMFSGADIAYQLASFTLEYLVQLDDRGNIIPVLCERVPTARNGDISKDGLTVTYHLRRNVTWSDGQPFTAADIIASWRQVMNPINDVVVRDGYDAISRIDAPDSHTAVVRLAHPYAPLVTHFFSGIQEGPIPVMPAHIIASQRDMNRSPFNAKPIGTGPFIVQSWQRNGALVFVANPHYWRGPPKLRKIIFQAEPSAATELVGLRTHEIDASLGAGASRLPEYATFSGMRIVKSQSLSIVVAVMNTSRYPFSDVHVRHAFAYAFDRSAFLNKVDHGAGVLADEFLPNWSWGYTSAVPHYPFDPKKAAVELDAAGYRLAADGFRYRNGQRLSVIIVGIGGSNSQEKMDALMFAALKSIGIDAVVKLYSYGLIFDLSGPIRQGNYDLTSYSYNVNFDPGALKDDGCDQMAPKGSNVDRHCDPVVDALEREAMMTNDEAKRRPLYAEIERRRMASLSTLPVAFIDHVAVVNDDLHGFTLSRGNMPEWNAWEWSLP